MNLIFIAPGDAAVVVCTVLFNKDLLNSFIKLALFPSLPKLEINATPFFSSRFPDSTLTELG